MIIIERVNKLTLNYKEVNNNNLSKDIIKDKYPELYAEILNQDYTIEVSKTNLKNYYKLVDYNVDWIYSFNPLETKILYEAAQVGCITGKRPEIFSDELKEIENKFKLKSIWKEGKWFVRLDSASPKDSIIKLPITNPCDLITSLVTSMRACKDFKYNLGKNCDLFFVKFDDQWKEDRELRVFVRNGKVMAISQYVWSQVGIFATFDDQILNKIALNVVEFVKHLVDKVCKEIGTYDLVVDLYVYDNLTIKLIELNSFGYWLASGSALFNWQKDFNELYFDERIQFRILI